MNRCIVSRIWASENEIPAHLGGRVTRKRFLSGVLIAVLGLAAAKPAAAEQSINTQATNIIIGIVVVAAAIGVVATLLVLHYSKKKDTITGCVHTEANGMSVTDEKDKQNYALSGSTMGVKPGDRVTLRGKRKNSGGTPVFETQKVTRDFGACQP